MGGQDKGLLEWRGQPLAAQVIARLRPQLGPLLVSCNRNSRFYAGLADAIVKDTREDYQGPLAGLEAAAMHISTGFLVVAPCDMPLLPGDLVSRLVNALDCSGKAISYAHDGERAQYLCAALRRSILPSLSGYLEGGNRAVRHWYAQHECEAVDFSDQAAAFANYNEFASRESGHDPGLL